ncbi:protoporphyrinogen/coproporphyrinogen oxidase [Desulfonatronovibrio hydrogenovorans]|uniref:protoporphyrinogen/coproporphyrinogen oxidase n=1 Tax=Desulfonatronovibrio hydrogenovorans TaxID=53245 RepID=UPI000490D682|nr:FAD-dependent oxidoreductase [Desulfonatronovibrio hydrogenovorans]
MDKNILIIGAGPTGLGAGHRLKELGYKNWRIIEKNAYAGGLASSFVDNQGYTWDVGGHVIFSHYKRFDRFVEQALGSDYLEHLRESWIRILDRWIPYPFQNNIRHLPRQALYECLTGLYEASQNNSGNPENFKDWILSVFGPGVAEYFMSPYNKKVWATPLEKMSKDWIAERVSVVDFRRVLENVVLGKDDVSWGPNNKFIFPLKGGTGEIFRNIAKSFNDHIDYGLSIEWIDAEKRMLGLSEGRVMEYDRLISTMPLDVLVSKIRNRPEKVAQAASLLVANKGLVVGVGFERSDPATKCWMYFPENKTPCYRVTHFSNYSHNNVPDINRNFSLMAEISYPHDHSVDKEAAVEQTIQGFINTGLINAEDRNLIKTVYTIDIDYSYPVPTLERDKALGIIQPWMEGKEIYSRGRFGAWKYEVGNMDHSVVQGMEVVDKALNSIPEKVYWG